MESLNFQYQDSTGKPVVLKEEQVEDSDAEKQWCSICKRYFIFEVKKSKTSIFYMELMGVNSHTAFTYWYLSLCAACICKLS